MSDFIVDNDNIDVLRAKILIMESTYVENTMTVEDAREYGHTHLSEVVSLLFPSCLLTHSLTLMLVLVAILIYFCQIISYADRFENKAILLIHFSARYQLNVIQDALSVLPPLLAGRVFALTEGF
ncbi:unnamed protein product [Ilex paraguariensis]|uniref:Uncharacterized protein n=1 Tax=Ilex paraguariensis TaxID=185542 RepID=A0ABC8SER2_9AQUA